MDSMKNSKQTIQNHNAKTKSRFYDKRKIWMESVPFIIFLVLIVVAIVYYPSIPSTIPTHWNARGQADGFGGRNSIFIIPIIFLVVLILLLILPLMEVFRENMIKIYNYYYAFKIMFSIFFAVLFLTTIYSTLGYAINVSRIVLGMVGVLFISLGIILPKLKRNFMFGIRTGWTLSSDTVWDKTHKIGGVLFLIIGIMTIIELFILQLETIFYIFVTSIILVSLFLVFYSYYLYKNSGSTKK